MMAVASRVTVPSRHGIQLLLDGYRSAPATSAQAIWDMRPATGRGRSGHLAAVHNADAAGTLAQSLGSQIGVLRDRDRPR